MDFDLRKQPKEPTKVPREPRTVTIDERAHSDPKRVGLMGRKVITEYVSTVGTVREIIERNKKPTYILVDTGEVVNVDFYGAVDKPDLYWWLDPESYE